MNFIARSKYFWVIPIIFWGMLAALSTEWNLKNIGDMSHDLAYERGQSMFRLVEMVRLWNAKHGGVYVPVSNTTPSNPYLEDPKRDISTNYGDKLTKLNPAYMTRQIADVAREVSGIIFNITSLNPINPNNQADPWEIKALSSFEGDIPEILEFFDWEDGPVYRYMGPLITKKACMKCHEKQGYRVGDIRGGISVTIPAESILSAQSSARNQIIYIHISAFILLTITTLSLLTILRKQWKLVNETKEKLSTSERFLRRITDSAGEGVVAINQKGIISFANPEAIRLLGWDDFQDFISGDSNEEYPENLELSIASVSESALGLESGHHDVMRVNDSIFTHVDGSSIPVSYVASPIMEGPKFTGKVILFEDITLRKEMEKTLVRSETMSALGGMVAGVAHEVNTPIGVSVTSASYLADKTADLLKRIEENNLSQSALNEYIKVTNESTSIILSNLERASKMIRSFKNVAADQTSEARSRFNLKNYLDSVLITLRPELNKTNLTIELNCPPDIELESFPGALSQVITNLVLNAKTHAFSKKPHGFLKLEIVKSEEQIIIIFTDNGKGIPPNNIDKIFAPFFTTRRGHGSSGLGLHISQNLVHTVLKGTINVSSQLDRGSQFTISIPDFSSQKTEQKPD